MKLLVCGGAGFIGSNFIRHMVKTHPDYIIVNYDKLTYAGNLDNLKDVENHPNYYFVQGDIVDLNHVLDVVDKFDIDHIINFAAETHVDRSIHGGCKDFVLTNTLGVQMLLDAVNARGLKRMVNVSTDEVYGDLELEDPSRFHEDWPIQPNMPYAAAKAGGDLMCKAYHRTHGTPVIVTHCSNNYGPYQFPEKLIPYFTFRLLNGENVPMYGDGKNMRDWIHVEDHARALDLLLHKGEDGHKYNIGSNNERSNLELTHMILELLGHGHDKIEYVADRPGHDRKYAIDSTKIMSLGWEPEYTSDKFEEGLGGTIEWYQKNSDWVEKLYAKKDEMNKFHQTYFNKEK